MKRKLLDGALLVFFASVLMRLSIPVAWYVFGVYLNLPRYFKSWTNFSILCSGAVVASIVIVKFFEWVSRWEWYVHRDKRS